MNKIIALFCAFLVCVKSEIRFEVQYFEKNITIREVYYSDEYINDYSKEFSQKNIQIYLSENEKFECYLNGIIFDGADAVIDVHYIKRFNREKKKIFDLYDCFKILHPSIYIYYNGENIIYYAHQVKYIHLRSFIERFYLYTQHEKINQKIKKYEINIDDLF